MTELPSGLVCDKCLRPLDPGTTVCAQCTADANDEEIGSARRTWRDAIKDLVDVRPILFASPGRTAVTLICILISISFWIQDALPQAILVLLTRLIIGRWMIPRLVVFWRTLAAPILLQMGLPWIGSYNVFRDVLVLSGVSAAMFAVAYALDRLRFHDIQLTKRWEKLLPIMAAVIFWIALSAADRLWEPRRSHPVLTNIPTATRWPGERTVGVALSGGGFRAALFHAGVLYELSRMATPIKPSAISMVSGGSILGSYVAIGGSPERFRTLVSQKRFNLKRELLNVFTAIPLLLSARVPWTDLRLAPFPPVTDTLALASLLDRELLGGVYIVELASTLPKPLICATDLIRYAGVGVGPQGIVRVPLSPTLARLDQASAIARDDDYEQSLWELLKDKPLSHLVAASGAFPGAFRALPVDKTTSEFSRDISSRYPWLAASKTVGLLADGGLFDNNGVRLFVEARRRARSRTNAAEKWSAFDVGTLVVSDASALREHELPKTALQQIGRAIDVMYASTGPEALEKEDLAIVVLSPGLLFEEQRNSDNLGLARGRWLRQFGDDAHNVRGLASLTPRARRELTSQIPEPHGDCARALAGSVSARSLPAECLLLGDWATDMTPEDLLLSLIEGELDHCLHSFAELSTLDDSPERATAANVFKLGQYLVWLNERRLDPSQHK
jgi:predicted acylesterase/phospholipase RssA